MKPYEIVNEFEELVEEKKFLEKYIKHLEATGNKELVKKQLARIKEIDEFLSTEFVPKQQVIGDEK